MDRRRDTWSFVALATILALLAAACGGDDSDAAGSDGGSGDSGGEDEQCTAERAGGSLTVGTGLPFTGMSPYVVLGTGQAGGDYMAAFYDTLMRYDATTQEFEPNVAESLEPNEDFTEWTLTLRPDVTFGNGDPLTTADVVAHIEKMGTSRVRAAGMANAIEGMHTVPPTAAFYAMPRVALPPGVTDEDYVLGLLRATGVLCVYGSGFGTKPEDGFFRVVFLADPGELSDIFDLVGAFTRDFLSRGSPS